MARLYPGAKIGPYQIERILPEGRGGFADVVVVRRYNAGHPVTELLALKVARMAGNVGPDGKPADADECAELFIQQEAEELRLLQHPGIVRLYPIPGEDHRVAFIARAMELEGRPWCFTMEYLAGGSIEDLVKKKGRLDVPLAVEIIQQVAATLDYIHAKGHYHLDVKANNILLRQPLDGRSVPQAVLVDFGAAQRRDLEASADAATVTYLSPERLRVRNGEAPPESLSDLAAVDIWALGVTFYQLLTGRLPFSGREDHLATAIKSRAPTRPVELNANLAHFAELDELVLAMLDKQPTRRPKADDVVYRLTRILPPPRFAYEIPDGSAKSPALSAARRWRTATIVLALVAIMELGGLGYLGLRAGLGSLMPPIVHKPPVVALPISTPVVTEFIASTTIGKSSPTTVPRLHPAPVPLEPNDGQWIENTDVVHLHWSLVGSMAADEAYNVLIWRDGNLVYRGVSTVSVCDYRLPGYGMYKWQVVVVHGDTVTSEPSVERLFGYVQRMAGGNSGLLSPKGRNQASW
jgi:serine/threonine protein kinase